MCCGGKCLFFIPIRTGSLIFGYFIAVISALGTVACTGVDMFFLIKLTLDRNEWMERYATATIIIVTGFLVEFLSSFICSVLLLVGITQNKPVLVKSFIIYGMVQVVLLVVFFIMVYCATMFFNPGLLMLALAFVGVYVICVYMVFKAYQLTNEGHVFVNPPAVNTGLLN